MKKIISIFIITLLSSAILTAQSNETKRADKHFNKYEFVEAATDYLKLVTDGKADTYVYSQLAESYFNVFNTIEAEKWYAKALETSSEPEMVYNYSQMLKANGKYEESNTQLDLFASMRPADHRATAFRENPNYLPKILEKGKRFNVQNLAINSEVSDFGGTLKNGKLYITSARNSNRKTYGWNEEPFLDIYTAYVNDDGEFQTPSIIEQNINTKYHEGTVSFSPDGNTMYFSRESFYEKVYERDSITKYKISVLNLYKSINQEGQWSEAEALSLNGDSYSVKNPSVSADGKTLYFASDKTGGYGNFDIYSAPIDENGSVGDATNLGQKLNTEGQEMFPFISANNTLYFSSNGHLGLGGLDVFFAKIVDGKVGPIRNIGIPVNGNADDFAFSINEETEEGFVSSNREGGVGSDDIYSIKKIQPICDVLVSVTVKDRKTGLILVGAAVSIQDADGNIFGTKTSNTEGVVEYIIECNIDTKLVGSKIDYESGFTLVAGTSEEEVSADLLLTPIDEIILANKVILNPIYFDFDKSNINAQAAFELDKLVQLMNKYKSIVLSAESHTDSRGSASYNLSLSERRAMTTAQYVISKGIDASRITGEGKGETMPSVDCGGRCTEEEHQLNRRSEFLILAGNPNDE
jgi:outer membrane protein OmpA-like peptidoglycan-associated protein/tetratricopeptide (TPR) repeat protein|tara:strand:- start:5767 stop:7680 length:1914 start_codon:yes stop_codon:yes gene_type:complete